MLNGPAWLDVDGKVLMWAFGLAAALVLSVGLLYDGWKGEA